MIAYWNLPESAYRDVRERDQLRVMSEDENVRIVRSRRGSAWMLVARCSHNEGFIIPDGTYRVPGWRTIGWFPGDQYSIERLVSHLRAVDSADRRDRERRTTRQDAMALAAEGEKQLQKQSREALDEASGAATERFYQVGRYFGPREATV